MAAKGKILLMDDDQAICDVMSEILSLLEYDVRSVQDGAAALGLYKREKEAGTPFDLVILDLFIPKGFGGTETLDQLKAYDPSVKAIVSSGYSDDPAVKNFAQYGFSGRLTKPYKISDLQNILDGLIKKP